jgi:hypothetical protein
MRTNFLSENKARDRLKIPRHTWMIILKRVLDRYDTVIGLDCSSSGENPVADLRDHSCKTASNNNRLS